MLALINHQMKAEKLYHHCTRSGCNGDHLQNICKTVHPVGIVNYLNYQNCNRKLGQVKLSLNQEVPDGLLAGLDIHFLVYLDTVQCTP